MPFGGGSGTPPAGHMIFGRVVGTVVAIGDEVPSDPVGDDATTMLGAIERDVALSVPVGFML